MMDQQERLDALLAESLACLGTLSEIVQTLYPDAESRQAASKRVCDTFELVFHEPNMTPRGHDVLQNSLAHVEKIFRGVSSTPKPDPIDNR